jgi:hypothetical protein
VSSTGDVLACEMNHITGTSKRIVVGTVESDDHNTPAMWAAEGRRALMAWTRHGADLFVHLRVSSPAVDVESFGEGIEYLVNCNGAASYAQIHHLPHLSTPATDVFWVFMRVGDLSWGYFQVTVDQGTGVLTHGAPTILLTSASQCYIATANAHAATGHIIRFTWGYNPAAPESAVMYVEIDAVSGAITSPVDPTVSANMSGVGLPLDDAAITPLLPQTPAGQDRRLFYARPGPASPAVAYAEWNQTDRPAATYKITQWDGTAWATTDYGTSGPRIGHIPAANYVAGMAFPNPCPDDRVAVARYLEGESSVELWIDGVVEVLATSPTRLVRPMFPAGRLDRVLCSDVSHYGGYTDYRADIRALFTNPERDTR